jgi:hypothetical protein
MTAIPVLQLHKEGFPFRQRTNISASEMYFSFRVTRLCLRTFPGWARRENFNP